MKMKIKYFLVFILLTQIVTTTAQQVDSLSKVVKTQRYTFENGDVYEYQKPKLFDFITHIPKDVAGTFVDFGQKNHLIALGSATLATVAILPMDQRLTDQSRLFGEKLNMEKTAHYQNFGPLSNIPPNVTSGIYLIGNGTTPILLSMGFATYGWIAHDLRALNTAAGLFESLATSGVYSQTIKRITGRQSPSPALASGNPGGDWNPFPSFIAYTQNTPNYDAMPSGHLMTATSALYVIMENYPEKKWIRPLGFSMIGVLGFQMVQSEVHWVSDYPIALVMGYVIGKNIANSKIKKTLAKPQEVKKYSLKFNASRNFGYNLVGAKIIF
ncbi:phosphatase PAP2 family protein [Flavobacterium branchiophilum]|nr:phosphatase PAP2 family protein [Flavobacterium branchiophilum]